MKDVKCPYCRAEFDVRMHDAWDMDGFNADCPECNKAVTIHVETTAYEYTASRDDETNAQREREAREGA